MGKSNDLFPSPWRDFEKEIDAFFRKTFEFYKDSIPESFVIRETKSEYIIEGNLPGFQEDQIQVTQEGNKLTISAENQEELELQHESTRIYQKKMSYGRTQQTFLLPQSVNWKTRQVSFKDGHFIIKFKKR